MHAGQGLDVLATALRPFTCRSGSALSRLQHLGRYPNGPGAPRSRASSTLLLPTRTAETYTALCAA